MKQTFKHLKGWVYFSIFLGLIVISGQDSIIEPLEASLATHMIIEHALYFTIGALSITAIENLLKIMVCYECGRKKSNAMAPAHGLISTSLVTRKWAQLIRWIFTLNRYGICWITISIGLIVVWHIPILFNIANENRDIHILQHISFIIVGGTSFLAIRSLGENYTIFLLFSMAGMMAFSGLVFVVLTERVYLFYSLSDHNQTGAYMIITSIILLLVGFPAYIIKRSLSFVKVGDR